MAPLKKSAQIPDWVLSKMKQYCAYQERCMFDVKTKLKAFHLRDEVYESIILQLKEEDYLNEARFAKTFANGKLRINHWGKNKIYAALQQKKVPELFILEGLNAIDSSEYISVLREVIAKKNKELKETDFNRRNKKLAKFAIAKGFENKLVWDVLNYKD
jgi:regulatory protein